MRKGKSVGGQTFREWLQGFIDAHHGPPPFDLTDARTHAYNQLPRGYVPSVDGLIQGWFTQAFNQAIKGLGYGLAPSGLSDLHVVDPVQLSFDDLWDASVRRLKLSREDVKAVRADLVEWAEANRPDMDIDATMEQLMAAAGF